MRLLLTGLLLLGSVYGQERSARWRQDLEALEAGLAARHPRLLDDEFRSKVSGAIARLRDDLDGLTDRQVAIRVAAVLATFGESHTHTDLASPAAAMPRLPVAFRWSFRLRRK